MQLGKGKPEIRTGAIFLTGDVIFSEKYTKEVKEETVYWV